MAQRTLARGDSLDTAEKYDGVVGEATRLLGVTPLTLYHWRQRKIGPSYIRVGPKKIVYIVAELRAFLAARSTTHEPPRPKEKGDMRW